MVNLPHIAIISSGRPGNVEKMSEHLGAMKGLETWYVGPGEGEDYRYAGAVNIVEGGALAENRNRALEAAFAQDKVCVQMDDDLVRVEWCFDGEHKHPITLERAVAFITTHLARMRANGRAVAYAGCAATDNAFFMPKKDGVVVPISEQVFIAAALSAHAPNAIRFDENLRLKEDVDYTIQHIKKYGAVARMNTVMAKFQFQTNYGGAVQYRTHALEQETIAYLKDKHPGWLIKGRNDDEIRLVYPPMEVPESVSPLRAVER